MGKPLLLASLQGQAVVPTGESVMVDDGVKAQYIAPLRKKAGGLDTLGAIDEGEAGGVEHGKLGINLFAEVLGLDEGVVTTEAVDLGADEGTIGRMGGFDIAGGENPDPADAILRLEVESGALLTSKEGGGSPGGAPEEAGGMGAGDHGGKLAVVGGAEDILGFVDGEEEGGGGTDGVGAGRTGEKVDGA